jgi:hypothetical protein
VWWEKKLPDVEEETKRRVVDSIQTVAYCVGDSTNPQFDVGMQMTSPLLLTLTLTPSTDNLTKAIVTQYQHARAVRVQEAITAIYYKCIQKLMSYCYSVCQVFSFELLIVSFSSSFYFPSLRRCHIHLLY